MNTNFNKSLFSSIMNIKEEYIRFIKIIKNDNYKNKIDNTSSFKIVYQLNCSLNELYNTKYNIEDPNDYYNQKQIFNKEINIYEFIAKIKEWSIKQDKTYFIAHSGIYKNKGFCFIFTVDEKINDCAYIYKEFYEKTEIEAIYSAANWFLTNINIL